jgi:putative glutamine amidotransferase
MTRLVAVSTGRRTDDGRERVALNVSYVGALTAVGLTPLIVPPQLDPTRMRDVLDVVCGLLLTGGEDVHPSAYGASPHSRLGKTDRERDAVEIALLRGAHERGLPVLAICRGIQLANVALGGTLIQDLPSERPSAIDHADERGRHALRLAADSLLHRTVGNVISGNSRHHQAVNTLAPGLRPVAWADDGVIEAVEWSDDDRSWMLAVQWHPEDDVDAALFAGFARAATEHRRSTAADLTGFAARDPE